ncbi:cytochrome b5 domain-containing protein [Lacrimispora defluvii]|uniref:cytochrome b5 domain-containing protein n=1 Tax=Lacrimispora defluvii TaxID=2719233 RepID=UPI002D1E359B|nr:cytochrome b5 domain-containing protein [Lacrimispora defluvii]
MDLDLLMTYLGSSLKRLNADVEKLRSNLYNSNDVLDHLSSELIMLQNHVYYFGQLSQMQENGLYASQMNGQAGGGVGGPTEGITGPTGGITGPTGGITGPTGGITGPTGEITGPTGGITGPTGGVTGPTGGPTDGSTGGETGTPQPQPLTYFTLEQLAQYDGKNGAPAYVAVNGVVYNVSNNRLWAGGNHFWGLSAGRDLSAEFASCHPGAMVLSVLPVVGYMVQE